MIGCYTLDLYCQHREAKGHARLYGPDQFTAETGAECRRDARRRGWKLNMQTHEATCPKCMNHVRKPK